MIEPIHLVKERASYCRECGPTSHSHVWCGKNSWQIYADSLHTSGEATHDSLIVWPTTLIKMLTNSPSVMPNSSTFVAEHGVCQPCADALPEER